LFKVIIELKFFANIGKKLRVGMFRKRFFRISFLIGLALLILIRYEEIFNFFYFFVDILKKICIFALYYVQKTTIN